MYLLNVGVISCCLLYCYIQMIQVSGNLKIFVPFQSEIESRKNGKKPQASPQVLGFVGECRPIESSSSILELSSPQSNFTSTISLDLKIISVEAS